MKKVKRSAIRTMLSLTKEQAQSVTGGVDCPDLRTNTAEMKINEGMMKINIGLMKINAGSMKI